MLRKILRKSQPNFQHYVKKIEVQGKNWFSYKKKRVNNSKQIVILMHRYDWKKYQSYGNTSNNR